MQRYLRFSEFLNESQLSIAELDKPIAGFKNRAEVFVKKIENGESFELKNGKKAKLHKTKNKELIDILKKDLKKFNSRQHKFIDEDGKTSYPLSQFEKTKEFGSSKGSGGGAKGTRGQESAQCIALAIAYRIVKRKLKHEDFTLDNINAAKKFVDVDAKDAEMEFYFDDNLWRETLMNSTSMIMDKVRNKNLTFHRGSKAMSAIYKAAGKALYTNGIKVQADKWNPGDIWMIDNAGIVEISKLPNDDYIALNKKLLELFDKSQVIGISLKKLERDAKLTLHNYKPAIADYNYTGYTSSETSMDGYILFDQGKMQAKAYNHLSNVSLEIIGKAAKHGKIGLGPINNVLKLYKVKEIPGYPKIQPKAKDHTLVEEILPLYKKYIGDVTSEKLHEIADSKKNKENWFFSKYYALKIIDVMESSNKKLQSDLINAFISYAKSESIFSSVYYKLA